MTYSKFQLEPEFGVRSSTRITAGTISCIYVLTGDTWSICPSEFLSITYNSDSSVTIRNISPQYLTLKVEF